MLYFFIKYEIQLNSHGKIWILTSVVSDGMTCNAASLDCSNIWYGVIIQFFPTILMDAPTKTFQCIQPLFAVARGWKVCHYSYLL